MKLNNNGYMLAEIIVCSVVTFAIAYFLIDITINFKNKSEVSFINSKYMMDYTLINKNVMDDIYNYDLKKVSFKKNDNKYFVDFSYLIEEESVLKRLTLEEKDNAINYKYGVYENNYIKDDYYVEKVLDNIDIIDVNISNKCFGDVFNSGNSCIKDSNYNGVKLRYNGLLIIDIKTNNPFIKENNMKIVIPYNNYETVIIPIISEEESI